MIRDSTAHAADPTTPADHLLAALVPPCTVEDHVIRVQASIGVATWPRDGTSASHLLEAADQQLYAVKKCDEKPRKAVAPARLRSRTG
ncbi:diguanylate cyclase domain-containing protein [Parasphingorhabdus sp.]|uniref:diguanylate cyclase domain-containing protein n=1 Tax=Parasphingorhabdus sp. TaxID=2709688 RepID=UPI003002F6F3